MGYKNGMASVIDNEQIKEKLTIGAFAEEEMVKEELSDAPDADEFNGRSFRLGFVLGSARVLDWAKRNNIGLGEFDVTELFNAQEYH